MGSILIENTLANGSREFPFVLFLFFFFSRKRRKKIKRFLTGEVLVSFPCHRSILYQKSQGVGGGKGKRRRCSSNVDHRKPYWAAVAQRVDFTAREFSQSLLFSALFSSCFEVFPNFSKELTVLRS